MKLFLIFFLGFTSIGFTMMNAQTLVRAGYDDPTLIRIAPGQVVTLYAAGLKTILPGNIQRATTVPLPSTLAGITVTLQQTLPPTSKALPLFAIEQFNRCGAPGPTADCLVTALTVQIPFDLVVPNPLVQAFAAPNGMTTLTISENGNVSRSFVVTPVADQIHVLTSCDINGQNRGTGVCYPIVAHSDGRIVAQAPSGADQIPLTDSEAKPGETLVMYLFGMGAVSASANAGDMPPSPPPTVAAPVTIRYEYSPNASPSRPLNGNPAFVSIAPPFAGLAPKQIGIYQVNFVVPAPPSGTALCGPGISSNLTVTVAVNPFGPVDTFDGAGICVDPR